MTSLQTAGGLPAAEETVTHSVTVQPFAQEIACEEGETVLEAAVRQGLFLRYGCRHGGCGTCKALLADGEVATSGSSFALSSGERAEGWVLLCSSRPVADCVVDVTSMELTEDEFRAGDQVGTFEAEVVEVDALTHDIRGLTLLLREPPSMTFRAGQFVNVEVPGTTQVRSYSIANAPQDDGRVELVIKLLPGGSFSAYLESAVAVGDRLRLHGPLGELKLRLSHRKVLMVAGGSGLAPFLSILRDMERRGRPRDVELLYGARRRRDLYRLEEIERLAAAIPSLVFTPVLSDADGEDWSGETGLVTELIARRFPTIEGYDAYLAGPPAMIEATVPLLTDRGVRPANVKFDAFVPSVP
ncbi:NAD(P)H-flavin reductase [Kribbella orskensis]|uniref:NAD(P)H-flavin reductase n=1 Tax=Kribbella orskensis TaxID=2512216 RepID=A0ABY2BIC2_9ACTN|nr:MULTISPECIES: 2Fe-2S iron-sulfur cluster binding domain-containing protein [Kribbella]TCN37938.1 NAD(P)H-flavin reductase [Kribbella sp. VKM Ac-2500]TCO19424.1 NAD(P)H-flavin reductase [Kribbella orskensis]